MLRRQTVYVCVCFLPENYIENNKILKPDVTLHQERLVWIYLWYEHNLLCETHLRPDTKDVGNKTFFFKLIFLFGNVAFILISILSVLPCLGLISTG